MSADHDAAFETDAMAPAPSYKLLVVDDSALNRKLLINLLKTVGHTCEQAEDGEQAVAAVRARLAVGGSFDAVLMDFVMPKMDGPTATAEIRALGVDWPIFGLTGNAFESDINTFLAAGVNKVLVKPLYVADFAGAMDEFKLKK
jgi:CheY-like chemotaxis protein